jgi:hypothetical protein
MEKLTYLRRFLFSFIITTSFINVIARENFLPGYLINSDNDTILGFIDYQNWERNPETIHFRSGPDQKPQSFTPLDIKRFAVKDEHYISAFVEMETSARTAGNLEYNSSFILSTATVFLQVLYEGEKNLFHLIDSDGIESFFIGSDTAPELLLYKRYLNVEEGDKDLIKENNRYLGQLTIYLQDCREITGQIAKTGYDQLSFENLFNYYYGCTQAESTFHKKVEKTHYKFGLAAGGSRTFMFFSGQYPNNLPDTELEPSYNFLGALFLEILFPRNLRKWSLYNEIQYSSYVCSGEYVRFDMPDYYSGYLYHIGSNYLRLTNLVHRNFHFGKATLFVGIGISNDFLLKVTNEQLYIIRNSSGETITEGTALDETDNYLPALTLGTGFRYSHFHIELRYQVGDGLSPYIGLNSANRTTSAILGYTF